MKKTWVNAEITELNIAATANVPTNQVSFDDFQDGYFKVGTIPVDEVSGSKTEIDYYPEHN